MNEDEAAIGRAVDAMYAMVSGPAGPRDWSGQLEAFHPQCLQVRTGVLRQAQDGRDVEIPWRETFTLSEYAANADRLLSTMDFFEVEIARRVQIFGNIAHVWSAYEARNAPDDAVPERRGINSIQLYRDAPGRWRITAMIWDNERPGISVSESLEVRP